jgi:hypothetical protein
MIVFLFDHQDTVGGRQVDEVIHDSSTNFADHIVHQKENQWIIPEVE